MCPQFESGRSHHKTFVASRLDKVLLWQCLGDENWMREPLVNQQFGEARPRTEVYFEHGHSGKGRSPLSGLKYAGIAQLRNSLQK